MRIYRIGVALIAWATMLSGAAEPNDAYRKQVEEAREQRVAKLTAEEGWLTLIGLHFLDVGEQSVGRAEGNCVRLAVGADNFGVVTITPAGAAVFKPSADPAVRVDGRPASGAVALSLGDASSSPTKVSAGAVSFFAIERAGRIALRVRDANAATRANFRGLTYFPIDPRWRIEAKWVAFDHPREIRIESVIGHVEPAKIPGKVIFGHAGRQTEMLAIDEGTGDPLFFVFSDATSGDETYGMRFLYAAWPTDGTVVLDFNLAYNPPCAFTPFSTCPLPPKENRMPFPIRAGERK